MERTTRNIDKIARNCIAVRLRMLNRVVTSLYDSALRPFGVKTSQLNILVVTAKFGVASPGEVCSFLQIEPSTLSRNVDRMRAAGWLEVVRGEDGRAQPFRLTEKGRMLIDKVAPAWEKAQRRAEALLGPEGMALLDKTTTKVRRGAGEA